MTPSKPTAKGKGKGGQPQGHWITIHGHDGRPHHVFIAGPRPKGLGHGQHASLAAAKGALTRGVGAQNAQAPKPVSPGATAAEASQKKLAGRATKASSSLSALRGQATKGAKAANATPRPAPTHPSSTPRAPLATGRGTAARSGQAAAIREGMAASRAGAPGSVPYREARRNYLDALRPGIVKRPAAPAPTPKPKTPRVPKPTAAPAPTPRMQPIVPRGTPERRAVAGQIRAERRGPDTDARTERLAGLKAEARTTYDRQVKGLPVREEHLDRVTRAFDDLARRNSVPLDRLRAHPLLAGLSRPEQDAAIHHLRLRDVLTLNSHEGRHEHLTRQQIRAAIREGPRRSILFHVSRREPD